MSKHFRLPEKTMPHFFEKKSGVSTVVRERERFLLSPLLGRTAEKHTNQQPNEHNTYDMINVLKM